MSASDPSPQVWMLSAESGLWVTRNPLAGGHTPASPGLHTYTLPIDSIPATRSSGGLREGFLLGPRPVNMSQIGLAYNA